MSVNGHDVSKLSAAKNAAKSSAGKSFSSFDWTDYLTDADVVAPKACFHQNPDLPANEFEISQKLEVTSPDNADFYHLATVVNFYGPRLQLRLDGCDSSNDIFELIDSDKINPIGTRQKKNKYFAAPLRYRKDAASYASFCQQILKTAISAPSHAFKPTPKVPEHNMFKIGMKLEAVDVKHTSNICPATIVGIDRDQVEVHLDGWDSNNDYKCPYHSRNLFPVGWCRQTGHPLQHPGPKVELKTISPNKDSSKETTVNNQNNQNNQQSSPVSNAAGDTKSSLDANIVKKEIIDLKVSRNNDSKATGAAAKTDANAIANVKIEKSNHIGESLSAKISPKNLTCNATTTTTTVAITKTLSPTSSITSSNLAQQPLKQPTTTATTTTTPNQVNQTKRNSPAAPTITATAGPATSASKTSIAKSTSCTSTIVGINSISTKSNSSSGNKDQSATKSGNNNKNVSKNIITENVSINHRQISSTTNVNNNHNQVKNRSISTTTTTSNNKSKNNNKNIANKSNQNERGMKRPYDPHPHHSHLQNHHHHQQQQNRFGLPGSSSSSSSSPPVGMMNSKDSKTHPTNTMMMMSPIVPSFTPANTLLPMNSSIGPTNNNINMNNIYAMKGVMLPYPSAAAASGAESSSMMNIMNPMRIPPTHHHQDSSISAKNQWKKKMTATSHTTALTPTPTIPSNLAANKSSSSVTTPNNGPLINGGSSGGSKMSKFASIFPSQRIVNEWSVEDVVDFLNVRLPEFSKYENQFRSHEIDGKAFLLLTNESMMKFMSIKLGYSLKICYIVDKIIELSNSN